jgi:hypothetical protein
MSELENKMEQITKQTVYQKKKTMIGEVRAMSNTEFKKKVKEYHNRFMTLTISDDRLACLGTSLEKIPYGKVALAVAVRLSNYANSPQFFVVYDEGDNPKGTNRPHLHVLIDKYIALDPLIRFWAYGFVNIKKLNDQQVGAFIINYLTKPFAKKYRKTRVIYTNVL